MSLQPLPWLPAPQLQRPVVEVQMELGPLSWQLVSDLQETAAGSGSGSDCSDGWLCRCCAFGNRPVPYCNERLVDQAPSPVHSQKNLGLVRSLLLGNTPILGCNRSLVSHRPARWPGGSSRWLLDNPAFGKQCCRHGNNSKPSGESGFRESYSHRAASSG